MRKVLRAYSQAGRYTVYIERLIKIGYWIALSCCIIAVSASISAISIKHVTQCSDRTIEPEQGFDLIALFPIYAGAMILLAFSRARSERYLRQLSEVSEFMAEPVFMWRNMLITHAHIPILGFCAFAFFAPSLAIYLLYMVLTRCAQLHF